jgi:hypothetical protein
MTGFIDLHKVVIQRSAFLAFASAQMKVFKKLRQIFLVMEG